MGNTHLSGLEVAGVPIITSGGAPFFTGRWIFVDAVNGDDGNTGASDNPLQTLPEAYDQATEGDNDVVVLVGQPTTAASTTGTFRLSAALDWAKSATHLIGMCAPTMIGQRARISTATGATTNINPLITVSAQGCYMANFSVFQGVGEASTDEQCFLVTGQRNYFFNVAIQGMGSANGAARAGSYNLKLYGAAENTFENCQIGVDTQTRSAANSNVLIRKNASNAASTRNIFKGCLFPMLSSSATALFIDGNESGGMDRFTWFKECMFHNAVNSTGTALTAAVAFHASQGGTTFMDNCSLVGANDYTASDTATVKVTGSVANGDTSGMAADANTT